LSEEAQHDQARMLAWRVGSYISEIEIQGHEDPVFCLTDLGQMSVANADELLITDGSGLVSGGT
jgi:hypothetical protein